MGNDKKLNLMKTNILLAAAKLFYDKGYNATSFEEIAEICDITKPLITYHYKTKANLANEVYLYFTEKRKTRLRKKSINIMALMICRSVLPSKIA